MHIIKIWDIKVVLIHSNLKFFKGLKGLNAKCFVQRYFCNRFTAT